MTTPERERPPAQGEGSFDPSDRDHDETMLTDAAERSRCDHALRYAALGWHVHPLKPGEKVPLTEHGHLDATTEIPTIKAWWAHWPDANIGVALEPSGLAVLDVDPRNGGDVVALTAACDLGHPIVQQTGGGGWHYLYGDRGVDLRSSLSYAGLEGIDVKRNGYIVVAPSVTTGTYFWYDDDFGVEPMPPMVLDLCRAPARAERDAVIRRDTPLDPREQAYIDAAVNDACQRLASTGEGYRHAAVYYTARSLGEYVGGGVLPRQRAYDRVTQAAETLYGEALWNVEVKTIEQGLAKGETSPRGVPDEHSEARGMLRHIAEAGDPMSVAELRIANNPELARQFGHEPLAEVRMLALKNVEAVAGSDGLARFVQLIAEA